MQLSSFDEFLFSRRLLKDGQCCQDRQYEELNCSIRNRSVFKRGEYSLVGLQFQTQIKLSNFLEL